MQRVGTRCFESIERSGIYGRIGSTDTLRAVIAHAHASARNLLFATEWSHRQPVAEESDQHGNARDAIPLLRARVQRLLKIGERLRTESQQTVRTSMHFARVDEFV